MTTKIPAYTDLSQVPDHLVGQIIAGELVVSPRPMFPHANASTVLGSDLNASYQRGRGGPGGWWIVVEPEVEFEPRREHYVPDLAGWRKERLPSPPTASVLKVIPDWVCEIVSPSSVTHDRVVKFRTYAKHQVSFYWIIDPIARTLEAYKLKDGHWLSIGSYSDHEVVQIEPFDAIEIKLSDLWIDVEQT